MLTPEEKTELVSGLREFADFIEENPEVPIGTCLVRVMFGYEHTSASHEPKIRTWAQALRHFEKQVTDYYFTLIRMFRGLRLEVSADRDRVCRKVKKTIEQEVWECPPSLLEDAPQEVTAA